MKEVVEGGTSVKGSNMEFAYIHTYIHRCKVALLAYIYFWNDASYFNATASLFILCMCY